MIWLGFRQFDTTNSINFCYIAQLIRTIKAEGKVGYKKCKLA